MTANVPPPEDIYARVEIHIVESEDGHGITSSVKGHGLLCVEALKESLAESIASCLADAPEGLRELMFKCFMEDIKETVKSTMKNWERTEEGDEKE